MVEVVHTTIGASEGCTTISAIDSSKVLASELLKSKVLKLPCSKRKTDPRKNCTLNKAKSGMEFIPRQFLLVTISFPYYILSRC